MIIDIGDSDPIECLVNGLVLFRDGDTPVAVLIAPHQDYLERVRAMNIEIALPIGADGAAVTQALFARLGDAIRAAQSYRGKVLSLDVSWIWLELGLDRAETYPIGAVGAARNESPANFVTILGCAAKAVPRPTILA